jgi:signal transduction histidine kinase
MRGPRPWWHEQDSWPPPHRHRYSARGRRWFVWRVAFLFGTLLLLSAVGTTTLVRFVWRYPLGAALGPLLLLALGFVLVAIFFRGMRRVGSPLGDIVSAADRLASGDYSARVVERGPPFLRTVARAFNSMTVRLHAQDQQRRHLMADIAHELRTPLTVMQGRLEGLIDGVYARDDERLAEVLEETRTLARLVDDLRTLANAEAGSLSLRKEPTDLAVLIHDAAASAAPAARDRGVTVRVDERGDLPLVDVDPLRIREVLTNLLTNALRHTPAGGEVTVTAAAQDHHVAIDVTDTGSGISPDDLPKIFDRFYKGPTSHGSGLGLTIARNLIVAHGGEMRADSRVGRGTTITFTLPLSRV